MEAGSELEKAFSIVAKFHYDDMRRAVSNLAWIITNTGMDITNNRVVKFDFDLDLSSDEDISVAFPSSNPIVVPPINTSLLFEPVQYEPPIVSDSQFRSIFAPPLPTQNFYDTFDGLMAKPYTRKNQAPSYYSKSRSRSDVIFAGILNNHGAAPDLSTQSSPPYSHGIS